MTVRERLGGVIGILMLLVVIGGNVLYFAGYSWGWALVAFLQLVVWLVYTATRPGPNDPPKRRWRDSRRSR